MSSLWNWLTGSPQEVPLTRARTTSRQRPKRKVAFASVESATDSDELLLPVPEPSRQRPRDRRASAGRRRRASSQTPLGSSAGNSGVLLQNVKPSESKPRIPILQVATAPTVVSTARSHVIVQSALQKEAKRVKKLLADSPGLASPLNVVGIDGLDTLSREVLRDSFLAAALPQNFIAAVPCPAVQTIAQVVKLASDEASTVLAIPEIKYLKQEDTARDQCKLIYHARHSKDELSDDYYHKAVTALYQQIDAFVEKYYCSPKELPEDFDVLSPGNSPWDVEYNSEFIRYTQTVAQPDPYTGGWNRIMIDPKQRKCLLIGILAQILETKIFNALLFGVDKHDEDMMELTEKTLVDKDGYERTRLRACTTRTILSDSALTVYFDDSVAKLTARTLRLLEPLHFYVQQIYNAYPHLQPRPTLKNLVQDLNDIYSQAGYLSLVMRHSHSIFSFYSPRPGDAWDDKMHYCIDPAYFLESKENVMRALASSDSNINDTNSLSSHRHFRPLVNISIWPMIQRHSPGTGFEGGEKTGFRVFNVCLSGTLMYWGTKHKRGQHGAGLDIFVKVASARERGLLARNWKWVVVAMLVAYLLLVPSAEEQRFIRMWSDRIQAYGSDRLVVLEDVPVDAERV